MKTSIVLKSVLVSLVTVLSTWANPVLAGETAPIRTLAGETAPTASGVNFREIVSTQQNVALFLFGQNALVACDVKSMVRIHVVNGVLVVDHLNDGLSDAVKVYVAGHWTSLAQGHTVCLGARAVMRFAPVNVQIAEI